MKKVLVFSLFVGFVILTAGTLSYFYDSEVERGMLISGHWASEIVPESSIVKKRSDPIIYFKGEENTGYKFNSIFRILDAPGTPKISVKNIEFISVYVKKDVNDFVVGMEVAPIPNGTYTGSIEISYPSYPYKKVVVPVTVVIGE